VLARIEVCLFWSHAGVETRLPTVSCVDTVKDFKQVPTLLQKNTHRW